MVENETRTDFKSFNSTIKCVSKFLLQNKFQHIYTNAKFKDVQEEFTRIIFCNNSHLKKEGAISSYQVTEFDVISEKYIKDVKFCVGFNEDEIEVLCSCALFELRRILCRHSISVLLTRKVTVLSSKYFLDRRRNDIKRNFRTTTVP
jgi:hypothetical protein